MVCCAYVSGAVCNWIGCAPAAHRSPARLCFTKTIVRSKLIYRFFFFIYIVYIACVVIIIANALAAVGAAQIKRTTQWIDSIFLFSEWRFLLISQSIWHDSRCVEVIAENATERRRYGRAVIRSNQDIWHTIECDSYWHWSTAFSQKWAEMLSIDISGGCSAQHTGW